MQIRTVPERILKRQTRKIFRKPAASIHDSNFARTVPNKEKSRSSDFDRHLDIGKKIAWKRTIERIAVHGFYVERRFPTFRKT